MWSVCVCLCACVHISMSGHNMRHGARDCTCVCMCVHVSVSRKPYSGKYSIYNSNLINRGKSSVLATVSKVEYSLHYYYYCYFTDYFNCFGSFFQYVFRVLSAEGAVVKTALTFSKTLWLMCMGL